MPLEEIDLDALEIQLLPEERKLLLKYGYPFEDERQQLEAMIKSKQIIETLVISRFYVSAPSDVLDAPVGNEPLRVRSPLVAED